VQRFGAIEENVLNRQVVSIEIGITGEPATMCMQLVVGITEWVLIKQEVKILRVLKEAKENIGVASTHLTTQSKVKRAGLNI
jgi:hypothetical protein